MGTRYQLYPKLIYGAVALTHDPDKLKAAFQSVWYSLLSLLKVNRHITKEFCTLPLRFQGLALPNPNIDVLSSKNPYDPGALGPAGQRRWKYASVGLLGVPK